MPLFKVWALHSHDCDHPILNIVRLKENTRFSKWILQISQKELSKLSTVCQQVKSYSEISFISGLIICWEHLAEGQGNYIGKKV